MLVSPKVINQFWETLFGWNNINKKSITVVEKVETKVIIGGDLEGKVNVADGLIGEEIDDDCDGSIMLFTITIHQKRYSKG